MVRDTFISLVTMTGTGVNDYGTPTYTAQERRVFAQWDGVKRSEFYQAAAVGLKPTAVFRVWERDYKNERYIIHNGRRYRVLRTYPLRGERIEIVVTDDMEEGDDGAVIPTEQ